MDADSVKWIFLAVFTLIYWPLTALNFAGKWPRRLRPRSAVGDRLRGVAGVCGWVGVAVQFLTMHPGDSSRAAAIHFLGGTGLIGLSLLLVAFIAPVFDRRGKDSFSDR